MPCITTCPKCGKLYEAASEEAANEPIYGGKPHARWCLNCLWKFKLMLERELSALKKLNATKR